MKSTGSPTEQALLARAREGDEQAFRLLVQRHEQLVRGTVMGILGKTPEAEDVALEVFVKLHEKLADFRGESKLSTYLVRIAVNLSINEQKRRQRKHRRLRPLDSDATTFQVEDAAANPGRFDLRDALRKALAQLDTDFRAVVVLRLIQGYSVRETADILDLPTGTVASRLARAQRQLQEILKKSGFYP